MNYVYPAVFYEEEGKISVIFPDLGNLTTFGDNAEFGSYSQIGIE